MSTLTRRPLVDLRPLHLDHPWLTTMPEIRECFIHYRHAHYVLVEKLGLGRNRDNDWALQALFADATDVERSERRPGLLPCQINGFVGKLDSSCRLVRGQTSNQTRIWPGSATAVEEIDGLVLSGLSYTPRSLILKFQRLDSQGKDKGKGLDLQVRCENAALVQSF